MSTLSVAARFNNIALIEDFIYTTQDIAHNKRIKALIIATEIFDNICEHAVLLDNTDVEITASHRFSPYLRFTYRSKNFKNLLQALKSTEPHFDDRAQRYRGFGLRMTKNLARKVKYRKFFSYSRITVYL
ncbi:MAG: hypothetical protein P1P65_07445 [Treponema sp.]